jgi:hypothetical protein
MSGNAQYNGRDIPNTALAKIVSETEDSLMKVTMWGRASFPSLGDKQPRVPHGHVRPSVPGVPVYSEVRTGQHFRPMCDLMT